MDTSDAVRTVEDARQAQVAAEESFAKLLTEELSLKAFDLSPTAMTIRQGPLGQERLIRANQAYFELTGYSADEVIGRLPGEVKLWVDHESLVEKLRKVFARDNRVRDLRAEMLRKTGETATVLIRSEIIQVNGRPCILSTLADITALVQAEAELRRLEAQLLHSQKLEGIGKLAGGIAHDFNNLLTVINGYCEQLASTVGPQSPLRADLDVILNAGQRAAALTRQLLAFGRRQVLQPRVLDLNAVVSDLEKMLVRVLGERITTVKSLDPALGATLADPGQIEQVIMNLAINARDAMPDGGTLTLETRQLDLREHDEPRFGLRAGRYVSLVVRDTGHGMDAETRAHIFEPFFTTKDVGQGTGLGLPTVYGIVKQSGGEIVVESTVGAGTTMRVFLPCVEAGTVIAPPRPHVAPVARGGETILLVEDEELVRRIARQFLTAAGYQVLDAQNGEEAIQAVRERGPSINLLVTDLVLPGIKGTALAEQLKGLVPNLKVLFVSGYPGSASFRTASFDRGVDFLSKPFTRQALTERVREMLDGPPAEGGTVLVLDEDTDLRR